jgi:hypothetical protein
MMNRVGRSDVFLRPVMALAPGLMMLTASPVAQPATHFAAARRTCSAARS